MSRALMLAAGFFGLMAATGGVAAQGVAQKPGQPAEPAAQQSGAQAAYEKILHDADSLIKSGNPDKAYALLEPLEFAHAGEERFDYLIGIAALDSGKPDKATFALERVLTVNPNSAAARLDMARAYFQLGDMPRAKTEFLAVLKQDIPDSARAGIEKYLDEIAAQESGSNTRLAGYIEGTAGHDSNANLSTSQTQILVDAIPIGPIALAPANIQTPDSYHGEAAGGEIRHSLNSDWGVYAGGDWKKRVYNSQNPYDAVDLNARTGVTYGVKAEHFNVSILDGRNILGGQRDYDATGLNAEWRHVFSPANQANISIQKATYRYANVVMQPNDFDRQTASIGWVHVMGNGKSSINATLYRGTDKNVSTIATTLPATPVNPVISYVGMADGDKKFSGLRLGGQAACGDKTILFASTGVQLGNYDKVNPMFLRQRNDRLADLTAGANWNFAKLWTLRPQLNYSKNASDIVIYSYIRRDVSLNIRRDFR